MAGLVLKLAPKERVLINGAVLENGAKRSRFSIITPSANVLRLKDAIHPDDANTPLGRICFQLQLILAGNVEPELVQAQVGNQLRELCGILRDPVSQNTLSCALQALSEGRFYSALKSAKLLLPLEQDLLAR